MPFNAGNVETICQKWEHNTENIASPYCLKAVYHLIHMVAVLSFIQNQNPLEIGAPAN